jgi:hypothetical protein
MATNAARAGAAPPVSTLRRVVIAATVGNVLEYFDFVILRLPRGHDLAGVFPCRRPGRTAILDHPHVRCPSPGSFNAISDVHINS